MGTLDMDKTPQRKIAHTLRNGIGTTAAGTPQYRAALLHAHKNVEWRRRREQITEFPSPENNPRAAMVSECAFVLKTDITNLSAQPLLSPMNITVKDSLRSHSAAQHIHHRQTVKRLSQKMAQSVTLAGRSRKQYRHTALQIGLNGGKNAVGITLHRLDAFHGGELGQRRRTHMPWMKILIKDAAVHHAPPRYHLLSQQKKDSPRVRVGQRGPVPCLCRVIQG